MRIVAAGRTALILGSLLLRAMFQRKKGRDLFDLYWALTASAAQPVDLERVLVAFTHYMGAEGTSVLRAEFIAHLEECLAARLTSAPYRQDLVTERYSLSQARDRPGSYDAGAPRPAPSPELAELFVIASIPSTSTAQHGERYYGSRFWCPRRGKCFCQ